MTQQTSPFIEGKFGWALGESNWNLGMDENLLKFSYLFDRNIDGIVASLPAPVNGEAYFNTTDNRIYYAVNGVFSSTPVPKWFEVSNRSDGLIYRFNGTALEVVQSTASAFADLANSSDVAKGDALIAVKQPLTGTVARTQHDKNFEFITPLDFGAVGDGVTNDTAKFTALEAVLSSREIDLLGRTYLVTAYPVGNKYFNGNFKRISDSLIVQTAYSGVARTGNNNVLLGRGVASTLVDYSYTDPLGSGRGYNLTAVGAAAMGSAGDDLYNCSAFGRGAMFTNQYARYNEAFGLEALYYTQGIAGDTTTGTRNSAFGSNAMRFNTSGRSNVAFGRNTNQIATTANENTFLGTGAGAGAGPLDISGAIINPFPRTASQQTGTGLNALFWSNGVDNTANGWNAGSNIKLGVSNVCMGSNALSSLESGVSPEGNSIVVASVAGTWSQTGTTLTFSTTAHGMSPGFKAVVSLTTGAPLTGGDAQYYTVDTVPDANTWTAIAPDSATRSGNCTRTSYYTLTPVTASSANSAFGNNSMGNATAGSNNSAFGASSLRDNRASFNSCFGALSGLVLTTGTQNSSFGYSALRSSLTGGQNSAFGEFALGNLVTGSGNTAFGRSALREMQDTSLATTLSNCGGFGHQAYVSGDNQIQLGNSATTTYVYGTVQNRSDIRDKADVVDTSLGLEFITSLRPVEGRWDMREDYYEEVEEQDSEGNITTVRRKVEKDGSKKRQRLHQWFIAQEVKELCDKLGVEFGGYQDHSVHGGCDVLSLGYDEFIPPIVKAIQELNTKMSDMEARLLKLESAE